MGRKQFRLSTALFCSPTHKSSSLLSTLHKSLLIEGMKKEIIEALQTNSLMREMLLSPFLQKGELSFREMEFHGNSHCFGPHSQGQLSSSALDRHFFC